MTNILIFGGSRGLGAALSAGLAVDGDSVWLVSRGRPDTLDRSDGVRRTWIQADLSAPQQAAETIAAALADTPIDVLAYNAGIWEDNAFSSDYRFDDVSVQDNINILNVNLTSAVVCIQALLPNLRRAAHAKVILIGSTSGLENIRAPEVAYTASKFGLRGVAHALRDGLRRDGIAVTCINPGSFSSMPYEAGADAVIARHGDTLIPVQDIVNVVKCVVSLSSATVIKEIDMPSMADLTA